MAKLARSVRGRMIISVNDISEMRAAFDGLSMRSLGIRYTVGREQGPPSQRATDLELLGTTEKPSPKRDGYIKLFFANLLKKFRKTNARLQGKGQGDRVK